jgi:hypothetical protein
LNVFYKHEKSLSKYPYLTFSFDFHHYLKFEATTATKMAKSPTPAPILDPTSAPTLKTSQRAKTRKFVKVPKEGKDTYANSNTHSQSNISTYAVTHCQSNISTYIVTH